jgi:hypothetical protein
MVKELGIHSLGDESSIQQLSQDKLREVVVDGPGKVKLAEVLMILIIALKKGVPQNIIDATCSGIDSDCETHIRKFIGSWNEIARKPKLAEVLSELTISSVSGLISISDIRYPFKSESVRELKVLNLGMAASQIILELHKSS